MPKPLLIHFATLVLTSALATLSCSSFAEAGYPNQAIKVIVPFPPGGGTDNVTRLLAQRLRTVTQWTLVIDNKAGAGGTIGMDAVAKSKPDGYTFGMGQTANLAINPKLFPKLPYNTSSDLVPVALVAAQPVLLVAKAESPFKSLKDLVTAAKAQAGGLTMASAGNGTVGHLAGEIFAGKAGIKSVHVPYKGAGPAVTDLLGGQVDYYFATPQTVVGFIRSGKLRALAVSSAKRLPVLPDTPTIAEQGYAGFDASDWKVLMAPTGTPAVVITRVNAEVEKAMASPEMIAQLLAEGSLPMSGSPKQVMQFIKGEQLRWAAVVRAANVKFE